MHNHSPTLLALVVDLPFWAWEGLFAVYAVIVTAFVVMERRRPTTTLALVLAMVFLPVIGLAVYLVFSHRTRRRKAKRERRPINPVDETRHLASLDELPADLDGAARALIRLGNKSASAPLRRAESVRLLPTSAGAYRAFVDAIEQAERTIHCEFYIWHDDDTARRLTAALAERAADGVKVRVIYDHLGSLGLSRSHFAALLEAGGQVEIFGRLWLPFRVGRGRLNYRNHRKIMTVDGERGFLGGVNVGDEYLRPDDEDQTWRDLAVELRGDAVIGLEAIFLEDWLASTGEVIDLAGTRATMPGRFDPRRPLPKDRPWQRRRAAKARARAHRLNPFEDLPPAPMASAGPLVQIIPSGPDLAFGSSIAVQFSAAVASANRRVWLSTPYFVPDEPLMLILRTAALRDVDLRILVPSPEHNDVAITSYAAQSYYEEILEAGGRIFEYQPAMLHSKYLIVDDTCAIGSANVDNRSFHINYEVTGMFYDRDVTAGLCRIFEENLAQAHEVSADDRADLPVLQRLAEGGARVLSPLL